MSHNSQIFFDFAKLSFLKEFSCQRCPVHSKFLIVCDRKNRDYIKFLGYKLIDYFRLLIKNKSWQNFFSSTEQWLCLSSIKSFSLSLLIMLFFLNENNKNKIVCKIDSFGLRLDSFFFLGTNDYVFALWFLISYFHDTIYIPTI